MFDWNIIGHKNITHFLEQSIVNDKLSQAYLFYGPKQIGKRTLVNRFVESLMCYSHHQPENVPCHECQHCQQISKNVHPDIYKIKKESDKKNITIEQIRMLQESLSTHSFFKAYKVAIIEGLENMSLAAYNALLKTLEEPRGKTVIVLIANHIDGVPATILSRVQKVKFLPVSSKEIYDYLVEEGSTRDQARALAAVANGLPGRALVMSRSEHVWQSYLSQLKNFLLLISSSRVVKFDFAEKFLASQDSMLQKKDVLIPMLNLWQLIVRDLMLSKLNQNDRIINVIEENKITQASQNYSVDKLVEIISNIQLTKRLLSLNVNPRLVLENLLLKF